jgi:hypothetical protein
MSALSHEQSTVVSRKLAGRAGPVKLDATDTADFIFGHVPAPSGDSVPFFDSDLHG